MEACFGLRLVHIYYAVNPSLRAEMPVKPRKMMSAEQVAIVNLCAIVKLLRVVKLLSRSIFGAAGSFG